MKIVTIVGARPQFVKAAVLSKAFAAYGEIEEIIIHTGQHFDTNMSDIFFEEMQIPQPKYNLSINSLTHGAMTGRMIEKIEEILIIEQPDFLLVYGDTNSTLAGAISASKLNIAIIHVEAGLRSHNMHMPEEINRILTDRISNILFCPTESARQNLTREGFNSFELDIVVSGDIMEDAANYFKSISNRKSTVLETNSLFKGDYYLCTLHRAENTNYRRRMIEIVDGLNEIAKDFKIVFPVHPRTKKILMQNDLNKNIILIDPVGYLDMIKLIQFSRLVITDSGGLQKEAYFFNKFCVTTRDQTEWVELTKNGFNTIVGANRVKMVNAVKNFEQRKFEKHIELYGGGNAANLITNYINNVYLKK